MGSVSVALPTAAADAFYRRGEVVESVLA